MKKVIFTNDVTEAPKPVAWKGIISHRFYFFDNSGAGYSINKEGSLRPVNGMSSKDFEDNKYYEAIYSPFTITIHL